MEVLLSVPWPASTSAWWGVLVWLLSFGVGVAALGIVPGNRKPSSAMAWLLLIFVLPVVGIVSLPAARGHRRGQETGPQAGRRQRHDPGADRLGAAR